MQTMPLLASSGAGLTKTDSSISVIHDEPARRYVLNAHRVENNLIVIDGKLDDPAWDEADIAAGFTQSTPETGHPATERTEVRILYDDNAIYVGARIFDRAPDSIAASLFRRGGSGYSDWFEVGFDSYNDRRTAFIFGVNPRGVRNDYLIYNDNQFDMNWDAVWEAAATIDEHGWSAEIRIPFSQLRYNGDEINDDRSWGVNFRREIARHGEQAFWAPLPPEASGLVSRFGRLENLRDLPQSMRLELLPYASGQLDRSPGNPENPFYDLYDPGLSLGADVKYGISSNMTLTATINPDFGQVEVDPAVVNLTAFETFFPERRPFFLEGNEIFDFGFQSNIDLGDIPRLFYSRRIGRAPQGRVPGDAVFLENQVHTPIAGAVKLSGKTSDGWSIGLLNATTLQQDARYSTAGGDIHTAAVEPLTNYSVGRFQRDLRGGQTTVGVLGNGLYRDAALESTLTDQAFNGGIDVEHSWADRKYRLNGRFAGSHTGGTPVVMEQIQRSSARYYQRPDAGHLNLDSGITSLRGNFADLMFTSQSRHWITQFRGYQISPGFEVNDMGFQSAADRRAYTGMVIHNQPSPIGIFQNFNVWIASAGTWNWDGNYVNNIHGSGGYLRFRNFWDINYEVLGSAGSLDDRLTRGGPLAERPSMRNYNINAGTDSRKDFRVGARTNIMTTELGEYNQIHGLTLRYRPTTAATVSIEPSLTRHYNKTQFVAAAEDPSATETYGTRYVFADLNQTTLAASIRVDWTFTPDLSLQVFAQPFVSSGEFDRFKEFRRPESIEFGVYGEDQGTIGYDSDTNRYEINPQDGDPSSSFTVHNPDFTLRSLRGNAVMRWEFRPGSTLYLVWQQTRRSRSDRDGTLNLGQDYSELFRTPANHTFLVKFSYWFGY